jgi:hypothetical protein
LGLCTACLRYIPIRLSNSQAPSLRAPAKQSISPQKERMDCFVACAPRNDAGARHTSPASRRDAPELCPEIASAHQNERAQGMPGARCTRGLVCKMHKEKRTRAYRFSGGNPAFPARWFYGLFRALPGDRAFLPPSPPRSLLLENLTPASGRQDHTTSPSASSAARLAPPKRPSHPAPNVRDDGQRPSARGGTVQSIMLILANREAKYFSPKGWTG